MDIDGDDILYRRVKRSVPDRWDSTHDVPLPQAVGLARAKTHREGVEGKARKYEAGLSVDCASKTSAKEALREQSDEYTLIGFKVYEVTGLGFRVTHDAIDERHPAYNPTLGKQPAHCLILSSVDLLLYEQEGKDELLRISYALNQETGELLDRYGSIGLG